MKKPAHSKKPPLSKSKRKPQFPRGWDERRVKDVIAYYDKQSEDDELAEYELAMRIEGESVMLVPTKLVPEILSLMARHQGED